MVDADLLSDIGDLVGDVSDGNGGESAVRHAYFELHKPDNWVVGLG